MKKKRHILGFLCGGPGSFIVSGSASRISPGADCECRQELVPPTANEYRDCWSFRNFTSRVNLKSDDWQPAKRRKPRAGFSVKTERRARIARRVFKLDENRKTVPGDTRRIILRGEYRLRFWEYSGWKLRTLCWRFVSQCRRSDGNDLS